MDQAPRSILELGANVGMNYLGIKGVLRDVEFTGVEINKDALTALEKTGCRAVGGSVFEFETEESFDLVFTKGVMIHINPARLNELYSKLVRLSNKYVLIVEYYSPNPVEVSYRGHSQKLFKRDFAGEMLDLFAELTLVDYGFVYHRGESPQDDLTWFLMQKYPEAG